MHRPDINHGTKRGGGSLRDEEKKNQKKQKKHKKIKKKAKKAKKNLITKPEIKHEPRDLAKAFVKTTMDSRPLLFLDIKPDLNRSN